MRDTEIEISNQTDVISVAIKKEKKFNVQKIINELLSSSFKYSFIRISFRKSQLSEKLRLKQQTSLFLFHLFIFFILLQIIANHINIKADLKRVEEFRKKKSMKRHHRD
jgi:hypothetical protein